MKVKTYILALIGIISSLSSLAQIDKKVQAGIIQYIVQNMEWSENKKQGNFLVYVVGKYPVYDQLKVVLDGKVHKSQTIDVKMTNDASDLVGAHIIYLSEQHKSEFDAAMEFARNENALLITSIPGYGAKGSGINFVVKDGKQAYELNQKSLRDSDIRASSKLKSLGIAIK